MAEAQSVDPRIRIAQEHPTWSAAQVQAEAAGSLASLRHLQALDRLRELHEKGEDAEFTGAPLKSAGKTFDEQLKAAAEMGNPWAGPTGADFLDPAVLRGESSRPHEPIKDDPRSIVRSRKER